MKLENQKYYDVYLICLNKITGEKYLLQNYEEITFSVLQSKIFEWKKIATKHFRVTWNDVVIYHVNKNNYQLHYKLVQDISKEIE